MGTGKKGDRKIRLACMPWQSIKLKSIAIHPRKDTLKQKPRMIPRGSDAFTGVHWMQAMCFIRILASYAFSLMNAGSFSFLKTRTSRWIRMLSQKLIPGFMAACGFSNESANDWAYGRTCLPHSHATRQSWTI